MNKTQSAELHTSKVLEDILNGISPKEQERIDNRLLLAAKIDEGRKAKGWKKSKFADEMKKKPSEISKWLSGTHNFTADTLWDIEDKLGIGLISIKEKELKVTKVYTIIVTRPAPLRNWLTEDGSKFYNNSLLESKTFAYG